MKRFVLIGALLALTSLASGCASVQHYAGTGWADRMDHNPEDKYVIAESTWHALNVLDTAQTLNIASSPECFSEADPLTRSIIGKHPGKSEVVAIGVAYSLAFHYIGRWLKSKAEEDPDSGWVDARAGWTVLSVGTKALTVGRNHAIGLRPFGSGCGR